MSDVQNPDDEAQGTYHSQISSAFEQAWNEVHSPEAGEESSEGAGPADEAGGSQAPQAPGVEPTGAPAESAAGTPGAASATGADDPAAVPAGEGAGEGAPAPGSDSAAQPAAGAPTGTPDLSSGVGSVAYATVSPLFDAAAKGINERSEQGFRTQAISEIRNEIDPKFLEVIDNPARFLIGETVPSLKENGKTEVIRDLADAQDWQKAARDIITKQVNTRTSALLEDAKPTLSILQDSIQLFQQNKDLVPGTAEFNPALAKAFVQMAKSYEVTSNGKRIGYRVEVQPLIDHLRKTMPAAPAAPTTRQAQAATQSRNAENGQFDAPQGGIQSKAGVSGEAGDDYSAFWQAAGLSGMNI